MLEVSTIGNSLSAEMMTITEVSREFRSPFDTTVEKQNEVNISEIEMDLTRTQTDTNSTLNSLSSGDPNIPEENVTNDKHQIRSINVEESLSVILNSHQSGQSTLIRWERRTVEYLRNCLCSVQGLWELTHTDLNIIYMSIAQTVPETMKKFGNSWKNPIKLIF